MNTHMISSIVVTLLATMVATIVFVLSGLLLLRKIDFGTSRDISFRVASAFFIGSSAYLGLFRTCDQLLANATEAFFISSILMGLISLMEYKQLWRCFQWIAKNRVIVVVCLFVTLVAEAIVVVTCTSPPIFPRNALHECVGSLHSGRYVALAQYIVHNNYIPVLGQNYGQSLLATVSLFCGANSPYLALHLWLAVSMYFLMTMVYGFFRMHQSGRLLPITAVIIVALGSCALSLCNVLIIDSGNPWLFNGYSDSLVGYSTFLFFLILIRSVQTSPRVPWFFVAIVVIVLGLRWGMSSPQNILLSLLLVFVWCVGLFCMRCKKDAGRFLFLGAILFMAAIIAVKQGGMLTPKKMQDNLQIAGLMAIDSTNETKVKLRPYLRYHIGNSVETRIIAPSEEWTNYLNQLIETKTLFLRHWGNILALTEEFVGMAVRALFIPLFGTIFAVVCGFRARRSKLSAQGQAIIEKQGCGLSDHLLFMGLANVLVLSAGVGVAFLFEIDGYKWELARFLMPGYGTGMVLFAGSVWYWCSANVSECLRRKVMVISACLLSCGAVLYYGHSIVNSLGWVDQKRPMSWCLTRLLTRSEVGLPLTVCSANMTKLLQTSIQVSTSRLLEGKNSFPYAIISQGDTGDIVEVQKVSVQNIALSYDPRDQLFSQLKELKSGKPYIAVAVIENIGDSGKNGSGAESSLRMNLEHVDADPIAVVLPYVWTNNGIVYGAMTKSDGVQRLLPWE